MPLVLAALGSLLQRAQAFASGPLAQQLGSAATQLAQAAQQTSGQGAAAVSSSAAAWCLAQTGQLVSGLCWCAAVAERSC